MKKIPFLTLILCILFNINCFAAISLGDYKLVDSGIYASGNGKTEQWCGLELSYSTKEYEMAILEYQYEDLHGNIKTGTSPIAFIPEGNKLYLKQFILSASGKNNQFTYWVVPSNLKITNIHYLSKDQNQTNVVGLGIDYFYNR